MAWTHFSKLFVNAEGAPIAPVPLSCIESAEYIIQSISKNLLLPWTKPGEARAPHVIAHFATSKTINISDTEDFQNAAVGLADYPFTALPTVGQGLICLNKTTKHQKYNMHLGAVVAAKAGSILISNMMEPFDKPVTLVELDTVTVDSAAAFRTDTFGPSTESIYALGLLAAA